MYRLKIYDDEKAVFVSNIAKGLFFQFHFPT